MTRTWLAVQDRLVRLPKFRTLSDDAQLTLFYVWCLAGDQTPEATWPGEGDLGDLLELHGRPRTALDELVNRRWLDVLDDGRVAVHDWDEHQRAASKAARNAWERAYMRQWRSEHPPSGLSPTPHTDTDTDTHRTGVSNGESHVNNGELPTGWDEKWAPFLEVWAERGLTHLPSEPQRRSLWNLIDSRPNDAAVWLREAPKNTTVFEMVGYLLRRWTRAKAAA